MPEARVVVLSRPGCHLCEEAREVVARVADEVGASWTERFLTEDATLEREYGELVPVVFVDGEQHTYWRVDADRLRAALRRRGGGPSWLDRWAAPR